MSISKNLRNTVEEVASFYSESFENLPHRAKYNLLSDFMRERPELISESFIADNPIYDNEFTSALVRYLKNQSDKDAQIEILDAMKKCLEHTFKDVINDALCNAESDRFVAAKNDAGLSLKQLSNGDTYWGRV